jgi:hypothetical protein
MCSAERVATCHLTCDSFMSDHTSYHSIVLLSINRQSRTSVSAFCVLYHSGNITICSPQQRHLLSRSSITATFDALHSAVELALQVPQKMNGEYSSVEHYSCRVHSSDYRWHTRRRLHARTHIDVQKNCQCVNASKRKEA